MGSYSWAERGEWCRVSLKASRQLVHLVDPIVLLFKECARLRGAAWHGLTADVARWTPQSCPSRAEKRVSGSGAVAAWQGRMVQRAGSRLRHLALRAQWSAARRARKRRGCRLRSTKGKDDIEVDPLPHFPSAMTALHARTCYTARTRRSVDPAALRDPYALVRLCSPSNRVRNFLVRELFRYWVHGKFLLLPNVRVAGPIPRRHGLKF